MLVTGCPRSGTTWVARELAEATGAALPGAEPMNPRAGQFGLGGTLTSWTALEHPTPRQVRLLQRCYRGRQIGAYSRYGVNRWSALLPWSHIIVKDPFALLAVPTVVRCTDAIPVVVYRHPGAVLASYRRMGWVADTAEIRALQGLPQGTAPADDVTAMIEFWTFLHERTMRWLTDVPDTVLVSHAELAHGGPDAIDVLLTECGLTRRRAALLHRRREPTAPAGNRPPAAGELHGFRRAADEVTSGWRTRLAPGEIEQLESGTAQTWQSLESRRFRLG